MHIGDSENAARPSEMSGCSWLHADILTRKMSSQALTLFVVMTNSDDVPSGLRKTTHAWAEGGACANLGLLQGVRRFRFPAGRGKTNLEFD